ncbi:hypothetical protein [Maritalea sp.]|uniref:hypothetical protein n=1 Tax=Maritalea sp. TaxID=2003361 RepID=UPI003EF12228
MDYRVRIALINVFDGVATGQIAESTAQEFFVDFFSDFSFDLDPDQQFTKLLAHVFGRTMPCKVENLLGKTEIDETIVTVKASSGIQDFFRDIEIKFSDELTQDDADSLTRLNDPGFFGVPTRTDCERGAELINLYASHLSLTLGLPHNVLWVTSESATNISAHDEEWDHLATRMRDMLGLIDIAREHLFVFTVPIRSHLGIRPTAFNGADNSRFCQDEEHLGIARSDWGRTTWMEDHNKFGSGYPELISAALPLGEGAQCRYLGQTQNCAPGSNQGYYEHILAGREFNDLCSRFGCNAESFL